MAFLYVIMGVLVVTWAGMAIVLFKTNLLD